MEKFVIKNKKISVIGAVRSGINAAILVKRLGGFPFVSDSAPYDIISGNLKVLEEENIEYEANGHSEKIYDCDLMVTSPGVPSNSIVLVTAKEKRIRVISEVELAYYFCTGNIISITGTNGKTTTTTLCGHVLNACGIKTYLAGNIGNAFSAITLDVKNEEVVALETSSFQLDHIDLFHPKISVILNITPDHLNRYDHDMNKYVQSKLSVYKNQGEGDYLILNADDEYLQNEVSNAGLKILKFSLKSEVQNGAYLKDGQIFYNENGVVKFTCSTENISLRGEHNYTNSMVVIIIAKIFGCDNSLIAEALSRFEGVEHRIEFVRELDGVRFYNDSKATNVDSVWVALRSFDQPLFLILGGKDKGNDYDQIKELVLKNVKKIYAIGSSADKVFNYFHHLVKVEIKKTLEDCVITANSEARSGDVVLLSPACASFDMFNDYEHRGKVFKEAVNKL